jgi:hypothetical protein|tara:strand:+ start:456 stop:812 length:357 start_codon:yes stop_codon:yes gene_type:complete
MTPANYNFKDRYKGDTSNAVQFTVTETISGVTTSVNLTGAVITMQIRKGSTNSLIKELNTVSGITIVDGTNGIFSVDSFLLDIKPSQYHYDIQFNFVGGVVKTYLKGIFNVVNDITNL